jgi:hypothetical protein
MDRATFRQKLLDAQRIDPFAGLIQELIDSDLTERQIRDLVVETDVANGDVIGHILNECKRGRIWKKKPAYESDR